VTSTAQRPQDMIDLTRIENIYLVPGYTDMRKQMDGLSIIQKHAHKKRIFDD
jgi:hypothetical protein